MIRAYSVSDVRSAEDAVRAGLEDGELMQRAAKGLAEVAAARLPQGGSRVTVLVGNGGNGGDALFAAARLAIENLNVVVVLTGSSEHEAGLNAARDASVVVTEWRSGSPASEVRDALAEADMVIDGILGIGARPGLPDHLTGLPDLIGSEAFVLAVDLPSGCDPAGQVYADSLYADETVTFGMAKPVHLMPATEQTIGLLTVIDIGVLEPKTIAVQRISHNDILDLWPLPGPDDDKYSRGVLGVVAGGKHYTGAPIMSVTAAVTAGVGMVRYIGPDAPTNLLRQLVPEAIFGDGKVHAWVIGSGLMVNDASDEEMQVARAAIASDLPVLLDAGGLDLLDSPRSGPTLLTPHEGELLRLAKRLGIRSEDGDEFFGDDVHDAPVVVARKVADHLQATVLLKGSVTVVVSPTETGLPTYTQADAPAWLATAGAGDALGGICGALLAAGLTSSVAGALGALVHGVAADQANPGGPVRALDIAHQVGRTVAYLLALPQ